MHLFMLPLSWDPEVPVRLVCDRQQLLHMDTLHEGTLESSLLSAEAAP